MIFSILHLIIFDINQIQDILRPDKAQQEIKRIAFLLFASIFGKIILLCIFICIYFNFRSHFEIKNLKNRLSLWSELSYYVNEIGEEVFNELPIGIILIEPNSQFKEIKWVNAYTNIIFKRNILNISLNEVNSQMADLIDFDLEKKITLFIHQEAFDCIYKKEFNVFYVFNVTEREKIKNLYFEETPVLVFLSFDNLENALKDCDLSEQSQIKVEYLSALSDFIEIYESYLRQLSEDKFLLLLNRKQLDKMIESKFSILKNIRDISNKYKLKITLSMGIACYNVTYNKLASYAQNAIELAQKRGGDQAVVNIENQKIQYFGAAITSLSTNSKVSTRVNAEIIKDSLKQYHNCFIMSHIYPDLDSLGAMLAFYKIASAINKNYKHYLILDLDNDKIDQNFKFIYKDLIKEEPYLSKNFITTQQAKNIINIESLLVVVDTQTKDIVNSPELLNLTPNIIVIDHHRATENSISNSFSCIESSASSTVEILIEFLVFLNVPVEITPIEASIMYGGMIVDTNYFIYRTKNSTLEVAAELISMGAEGSKIKFWLRQELNKVLEMNKLISEMEIYIDEYVIIKSNNIYNNRSFLAKISEKALDIQNIKAAFTICRLEENQIGISARSYDEFNVQIIMEQMGGGGHINSAASQIQGNNIDEIVEKLKNILLSEHKEGSKNMNMKVILLEDIKNKGKKDDIIDVSLGYGNFLIKEKKAILANKQNLQNLEKEKKIKQEYNIQNILIMKQLKKDIDGKQIEIFTTIGPQGKIYGKITLNQILEAFHKEHNILLSKKKIFLDDEINSIGKYKANVILSEQIHASFIINIKNEENKK